MDTQRGMVRNRVIIASLIAATAMQGCATTGTRQGADTAPMNSTSSEVGNYDAFEDTQFKLVDQGIDLVNKKQPQQAIDRNFEPVIEAYAAKYANAEETIFSALTMVETLSYLVSATAEHDSGTSNGKSTIVIGPAWAYAWFWKGFALAELGDIPAAQTALREALKLSPSNPHFLSELAYTYIRENRWIESLTTYESAEGFASFAPDSEQDAELGRAWRGQGYALVELGRYDEAEAKYRACLALDPRDERARGELGYVLEQKAKAKANKL